MSRAGAGTVRWPEDSAGGRGSRGPRSPGDHRKLPVFRPTGHRPDGGSCRGSASARELPPGAAWAYRFRPSGGGSPRGAGLRCPEIHVKGFYDGSQDPRSTGWGAHLHGRSRDGIRCGGGLASPAVLQLVLLLAVLLDVLRLVRVHDVVRADLLDVLDLLHVARRLWLLPHQLRHYRGQRSGRRERLLRGGEYRRPRDADSLSGRSRAVTGNRRPLTAGRDLRPRAAAAAPRGAFRCAPQSAASASRSASQASATVATLSASVSWRT